MSKIPDIFLGMELVCMSFKKAKKLFLLRALILTIVFALKIVSYYFVKKNNLQVSIFVDMAVIILIIVYVILSILSISSNKTEDGSMSSDDNQQN